MTTETPITLDTMTFAMNADHAEVDCKNQIECEHNQYGNRHEGREVEVDYTLDGSMSNGVFTSNLVSEEKPRTVFKRECKKWMIYSELNTRIMVDLIFEDHYEGCLWVEQETFEIREGTNAKCWCKVRSCNAIKIWVDKLYMSFHKNWMRTGILLIVIHRNKVPTLFTQTSLKLIRHELDWNTIKWVRPEWENICVPGGNMEDVVTLSEIQKRLLFFNRTVSYTTIDVACMTIFYYQDGHLRFLHSNEFDKKEKLHYTENGQIGRAHV